MDRQEAEQLAERIQKEAGEQIAVLGIQPLGPAGNLSYGSSFFVKCSCKITGLQFVMKSAEQWEHLHQHIIMRLCRWVYSIVKR